MKRRLRLQALALVLPLGLAACGSVDQPEATGDSAQTEVKLLLPSLTSAWADVLVAHGAGIFEKHGIDLNLLPTVTNATTQVQATVAGDADITGTSYTTTFAAVDSGQAVSIALPGANTQNSVVVASAAWIENQEANGVTVDSTPEEKVKALDGAKVGVAALGTASETLFRELFDSYDVKYNDSSFVGLGDPRGLDSGLRTEQVDIIFTGLPGGLNPTKGGYGDVWLGPEDYAQLEPWNLGTLGYIGSNAWIKDNSGTAEKFLDALNEARELILNDSDAAVEAFLKVATDADPELSKQSFELIAGNYEGDAVFTEKMFELNREIHNAVADKPTEVAYEDGVWEGIRE